jgi:hypothetical protein
MPMIVTRIPVLALYSKNETTHNATTLHLENEILPSPIVTFEQGIGNWNDEEYDVKIQSVRRQN